MNKTQIIQAEHVALYLYFYLTFIYSLINSCDNLIHLIIYLLWVRLHTWEKVSRNQWRVVNTVVTWLTNKTTYWESILWWTLVYLLLSCFVKRLCQYLTMNRKSEKILSRRVMGSTWAGDIMIVRGSGAILAIALQYIYMVRGDYTWWTFGYRR